MNVCTCGGELDTMALLGGGAALWQCRRCGKPTLRPAQQPRGRVERAGLVVEVVEAAGEIGA